MSVTCTYMKQGVVSEPKAVIGGGGWLSVSVQVISSLCVHGSHCEAQLLP